MPVSVPIKTAAVLLAPASISHCARKYDDDNTTENAVYVVLLSRPFCRCSRRSGQLAPCR